MKETDLWGMINKNLGAFAHWQRIESGVTAAGIPDINACADGVDVWVEDKIVKHDRIEISPFQVNWLTKRWSSGGRAFILAVDIRPETRFQRLAVNRLILWPGCVARELKTYKVGEVITRANIVINFKYRDGVTDYDWKTLYWVLFETPRTTDFLMEV